MAQALVPLKDLVRAKTRLAGILDASERRALAQAMAEDVLSALARHPGLSTVTLVSDDPGAHLLAGEYDIRCWPERDLGCKGLNPVIAAASQRLLQDSDETLLVLHGDLPLLTVEDVSAVLELQQQTNGLVIGTDRRKEGTNLLAFDRHCMPHFQFGEGSCEKHRIWAAQEHVTVDVISRLGIALDIDDAKDLEFLYAHLVAAPKSKTAEFLSGEDLVARLALALASLSTDNALLVEVAGSHE